VAAAANRFMSEALVAAIPGQLGISRDPKISEILTAASRRADTLSDQPLVEANARAIIGGAYQGLSRPADARPHLERALAIRSARLPPEHIDVLQSRRMMAQLDHNTGRTKEALKAMVELAEIDARALGPDHRETLVVLNTLGTLHQLNGDLTAAEKCQRAVYESRLRTLGPDHIETLGARRDIAGIMVHQHHFDEAVTELRDIIDSLRRRNDLRDGFIIALTNQDLAVALREAGKVDEAAPLFREAIAGLTASAGPEHRILLNAEHNLGNLLLFNRNDPEGALPLLRHAADTSARVMSADHVMTIRYRKTLGRCLLTMGRRDEAFTVFSAAHESAHRTLGPDHADTRDLATWIERTATGR
jgi:tetratricopeptide (TPR) repeat protein